MDSKTSQIIKEYFQSKSRERVYLDLPFGQIMGNFELSTHDEDFTISLQYNENADFVLSSKDILSAKLLRHPMGSNLEISTLRGELRFR